MEVDLTDDEVQLVNEIEFDASKVADHEAWKRNSEIAAALTKSLLTRKAVPDARLRYFTDPDYRTGRMKGSRFDIFKRNGNDFEETIRHNHFLKYLRYFVYGSELPEPFLSEFGEAVADCGDYISSGDAYDLSRKARAMYRRSGLEREWAADEFFKLAIDLGMSASHAMTIRKAIIDAR
ncbi:hypothetical protein [Nitratireductor rhodophyticola]|uniref:hypothetical protein n=1 Tax=Nitratireductor rhodophyticola TaxID=2854036 RepID=UPI003BAD8F2F